MRAAGPALAVSRLPPRWLPGGSERWTRHNYRRAPVSLLEGPALVAAALLAGPVPEAAAALVAAAVGWYDDVAGQRAGEREVKGLAGHLGRLRQGQVTAGSVKLAGLAVAGLVGAIGVGRRRPGEVAVGAVLVAGTANLGNLLDLRPGRAAKAALPGLLLTGQRELAGTLAVLLPGELRERTMLGDLGANALGAALGTGLLRRARGGRSQLAVAAVVAGLNLASERVSFSAVVERTPLLARIDGWGRKA